MSDNEEKETVDSQDGRETAAELNQSDSDEPEQNGNDAPKTVPYSRFKEVNEKAKERERRLAELEEKLVEREQAEEERRKEEMKKKEQYQELAEELDTELSEVKPAYESAKERIKELEEILSNHAKSQIDLVPEIYRSVVESMPLVERLNWLNDNREKLASNKPSGIPETPKGKNPKDLTENDRRRKAARTF